MTVENAWPINTTVHCLYINFYQNLIIPYKTESCTILIIFKHWEYVELILVVKNVSQMDLPFYEFQNCNSLTTTIYRTIKSEMFCTF